MPTLSYNRQWYVNPADARELRRIDRQNRQRANNQLAAMRGIQPLDADAPNVTEDPHCPRGQMFGVSRDFADPTRLTGMQVAQRAVGAIERMWSQEFARENRRIQRQLDTFLYSDAQVPSNPDPDYKPIYYVGRDIWQRCLEADMPLTHVNYHRVIETPWAYVYPDGGLMNDDYCVASDFSFRDPACPGPMKADLEPIAFAATVQL